MGNISFGTNNAYSLHKIKQDKNERAQRVQ